MFKVCQRNMAEGWNITILNLAVTRFGPRAQTEKRTVILDCHPERSEGSPFHKDRFIGLRSQNDSVEKYDEQTEQISEMPAAFKPKNELLSRIPSPFRERVGPAKPGG